MPNLAKTEPVALLTGLQTVILSAIVLLSAFDVWSPSEVQRNAIPWGLRGDHRMGRWDRARSGDADRQGGVDEEGREADRSRPRSVLMAPLRSPRPFCRRRRYPQQVEPAQNRGRRAVNDRSNVGSDMDIEAHSPDDPLVVVSARHLDDVCELARALAARGDPADPLVDAIRGAIAQIRADAVHEPA